MVNQNRVELTQKRYPELKRGSYNKLTDSHINTFEQILGKSKVITAPDDVDSYNVDWLRTVRGHWVVFIKIRAGQVVLRPTSTEEVSQILKFCNDELLAVCPQGGNTGLVGGSVPVFDEVILSTALMKNILSVDDLSGVLVCQAGCVLEELDTHLNTHGLMMPLDLGAKGSCHIGGNVSTNAGGLRLMRYGSLHDNILGVEAVKADGTIVDCLNINKKDNTGYALHHLFIGSEGTLGVVTKVSIKCPPSPRAVSLAFLGVRDFDNVLKTAKEARNTLGEVLSSCEMLDAECADAVTNNLGYKHPLQQFPFYMLLETSGSNAAHDEEKLASFLERAMNSGIVEDGTVVTEPSKIRTLWQFRECIAEALLKDGYVYKYDISLPLPQFYGLVPEMSDRVRKEGALRCCGFGHLGDGNIHFNVTAREFSHKMLDVIEPFVYEWSARYNGSISAEHGIGLKKRKFLHFSKSPAAIAVMKDIKHLMDPKGILNPYKVLP
ncbi:hypothetical protein B566_EDAN001002 [Ephemera danica]|nr:hypothetical protein B566_EDAN001002 [Ephemera danica]